MTQETKIKLEEPKKDVLFTFKSVAYHLTTHPSELESGELKDLIKYARFQLCMEKKLLYSDPIWDAIADVDILVEYFALIFFNDPETRKKFKNETKADSDADIDWMESQIEQNQKTLEVYDNSMETLDNFEVTPQSLVKEKT